jgi:hypothetical protein
MTLRLRRPRLLQVHSQRGTPTRRLASALVVLLLAGCTCAECDLEKIPHKNVASTPGELAEIVQYEAKYDCRSELYDLLSARTRDKYSRTEWRIGVGTIKLPPPYDYKVVDVAEKGTFDGAIIDPENPNEGFAYYFYEEPGKKKLRLKLLILREPGESTAPAWRLALVDQQDRIDGGLAKTYWWFDED